MAVKDIYYDIEDKYYFFLDMLEDKGIKVYSIIDPIEEKGVPTFPLAIGIILLIFLFILWILLGGLGHGNILELDIGGQSLEVPMPTVHNIFGGALDSILPPINLPEEGDLKIEVTVNSGGDPIEGAKVEAEQEGEVVRDGTTDSEGFLELAVEEKFTRVTASAENCTEQTKTIEESGELLFDLDCGKIPRPGGCLDIPSNIYQATLIGREDNKEAENCQVSIFDEDNNAIDLGWEVSGSAIQLPDPTEYCIKEDYLVIIDCLGHERTDSASNIVMEIKSLARVYLDSKNIEYPNPHNCENGEEWNETSGQCEPIVHLCGEGEEWDPVREECVLKIVEEEVLISVKVNSSDGLLEGIEVTALDSSGVRLTEGTTQAYTQANGEATLSIPKSTEFMISAVDYSETYATTTTDLQVADKPKVIYVTMEGGLHTVLKVVDNENQQGIQGASIRLLMDGYLLTGGVTDSEGRIDWVLREGPAYTVEVWKSCPGTCQVLYYPAEGTILVGDTTTIGLERVYEIEAGEITLKAKDANGGENDFLSGVTFELENSQGLTAAGCITKDDGSCYLKLAMGTYTVYASTQTISKQYVGDVEIEPGLHKERIFEIKPPEVNLTLWTWLEYDESTQEAAPNSHVIIDHEDIYGFRETLYDTTTDHRGRLRVTLDKNEEIWVRTTYEEGGKLYSANWGPTTISKETTKNLVLKEPTIEIDFGAPAEIGAGKGKQGDLCFGLPYYDDDTEEKYEEITIEIWIGENGNTGDLYDTPVVINGFESAGYAKDEVEVLRCKEYDNGESQCGASSQEQLKYLKFEIEEGDRFYDNNANGRACIPIDLYAKEAAPMGETIAYVKGTWEPASGTAVEKEAEYVINVTNGSSNHIIPPDNEDIQGSYEAGLSIKKDDYAPWPTSIKVTNGSYFYIHMDILSSEDQENYEIKLEEFPPEKLELISYFIGITRKEGDELGGGADANHEYEISGNFNNGEYEIDPTSESDNYRLYSEDILHLKVKVKTIGTTNNGFIRVLEDEDNELGMTIKDLGEDSGNESTPVANIVCTQRHYQANICPTEGFLSYEDPSACVWGTFSAKEIDQGTETLPSYSKTLGGPVKFKLSYTLYNEGDEVLTIDLDADYESGTLQNLVVPTGIDINPQEEVTVTITGEGLEEYVKTMELQMGLEGADPDQWKTIQYGDIAYDFHLKTNSSEDQNLNEMVIVETTGMTSEMEKNSQTFTSIGPMYFGYCPGGGSQMTVMETLTRHNDKYVRNPTTHSEFDPNQNPYYLRGEHDEFGSLNKEYIVEGMAITPEGLRNPPSGNFTFNPSILEDEFNINVKSWWQTLEKDIEIDTEEFFTDSTNSYDVEVIYTVFNEFGEDQDGDTITTEGKETIEVPEKGHVEITVSVKPNLVDGELPACIDIPFSGEIKIDPDLQSSKTYEFHYNCTGEEGWDELFGLIYEPEENDRPKVILTKDDSSNIQTVNLTSLLQEDVEVEYEFQEDTASSERGYQAIATLIPYTGGTPGQETTLQTQTPTTVTISPGDMVQFKIEVEQNGIDVDEDGENWDCENLLAISDKIIIKPDGYSPEVFFFPYHCDKEGQGQAPTGDLILRETRKPAEIDSSTTELTEVCTALGVEYRLCDAEQLANALKKFYYDYDELDIKPLSRTRRFAFGNDRLIEEGMETATGKGATFSGNEPSSGEMSIKLEQGETAIECGVVTATVELQGGGWTKMSVEVEEKPWCETNTAYSFIGQANYDGLLTSYDDGTQYMRFRGDAEELEDFKEEMDQGLGNGELNSLDVLGYKYTSGYTILPVSDDAPVTVFYNDIDCSPGSSDEDCPGENDYREVYGWLWPEFVDTDLDMAGYYNQDISNNKYYIGIIYKNPQMGESGLAAMRGLLIENLIKHWAIGSRECINSEEEVVIGPDDCEHPNLEFENYLEEITILHPDVSEEINSVGLAETTRDGNPIGTPSNVVKVKLTVSDEASACKIWNEGEDPDQGDGKTIIKGDLHWTGTQPDPIRFTVPVELASDGEKLIIWSICYKDEAMTWNGGLGAKDAKVYFDQTAPTISGPTSSIVHKDEGIDTVERTITITDDFDVQDCTVKHIFKTSQPTCPSCSGCDSDICGCESLTDDPDISGFQAVPNCKFYLLDKTEDVSTCHTNPDPQCVNKYNITCRDINGNLGKSQIDIIWGDPLLEATLKTFNIPELEDGQLTNVDWYMNSNNIIFKKITGLGEGQGYYYTNKPHIEKEFTLSGNYPINQDCTLNVIKGNDMSGTPTDNSGRTPSCSDSGSSCNDTPPKNTFNIDDIHLPEDGLYYIRTVCSQTGSGSTDYNGINEECYLNSMGSCPTASP